MHLVNTSRLNTILMVSLRKNAFTTEPERECTEVSTINKQLIQKVMSMRESLVEYTVCWGV